MKKIEKYLFNRYKHWVDKAIKGEGTNNWIIVFEYEGILKEFFEYDFSYIDRHYYCIKKEKTIYDYILP